MIADAAAPDPSDVSDGLCDLTLGCNAARGAPGAAKDAAGNAASGAADSFMEKLIEGTLNALVDVIGSWVNVILIMPGPNVGSVEGRSMEVSPTLASTFGVLSWMIIALTMLSLIVAITRMIWTMEGAESKVIVRMMVNLVASTTVILGMTILLLEFSDRASPWLLLRISGYKENEMNSGEKFTELLLGIDQRGGAETMTALTLIGLLLLIITFAGVLMQMIFMIVRNPLIVVMVAFLPLFAANSGTRAGQERFNKAIAFLLAFILYKPVVAIIMGIGLRMLKPLDAEENPLMTFVSGMVLVALAGFALPAMVKMFVQDAAVGSSNAFSGGAAIAAGGAAVMSTAMLAGAFASGGATGGAAGAAGSTPPSGGPPPGNGGGGPPASGGQPQLPSGGGTREALPPGPTGGGRNGGSNDSGQSSGTGSGNGTSVPAGGGGSTPDPGGQQPGSGDVVSSSVVSDSDGGSTGTGAPGDSGSGGPAGPEGSGRDGRDGRDGTDGQEGPRGQDGARGPDGQNSGGNASSSANSTPGASTGTPGMTSEGAPLVGKAALAAGTLGQQSAQGADRAANDMAEGARA